jgi:hypothetical protein
MWKNTQKWCNRHTAFLGRLEVVLDSTHLSSNCCRRAAAAEQKELNQALTVGLAEVLNGIR